MDGRLVLADSRRCVNEGLAVRPLPGRGEMEVDPALGRPQTPSETISRRALWAVVMAVLDLRKEAHMPRRELKRRG